ncbi:mechanosensitive ion channel family protein [bacterium]|nr:mechanosensitive ion channel family protein [bacterium]MBU1614383.1 mechanosensitive ion channel family protein [bacterium]
MEIYLGQYINRQALTVIFRCAVLLALGLPAVFWISKIVRTYITKHSGAQQGMMAGKIVLYSGVVVIAIAFLKELGIPLTHLLGAAGILGLALGFASQTSISNIISGLFLVAEGPFIIGDVITVDNTTGVVLSIDTLSIKLRTFDNRFVRIPNETILKSQVINVTRFPIRRIDLKIGVAYKEDISRVRDILLDIACKNLLCLREPEPLVIFTGYGTSSIDILFAVWVEKTNWLKAKNSLMEKVKKRFDEEGIEIPFPHLSIYKGLATQAFPVRIV